MVSGSIFYEPDVIATIALLLRRTFQLQRLDHPRQATPIIIKAVGQVTAVALIRYFHWGFALE